MEDNNTTSMDLLKISETAEEKAHMKKRDAAVDVCNELSYELRNYENCDIEEEDLLKLLKKCSKKVKKVIPFRDAERKTWDNDDNDNLKSKKE